MGLATTLLFFATIEVALRAVYAARSKALDSIPLPYAFDSEYGPVPPWVNGTRLLVHDPVLFWKMEPGAVRRYVDIFGPAANEAERMAPVREFFPRLPASLRASAAWEIVTNSDGFRDVAFARDKPAGTYRVMCLGDSWTFGANVGQDETYPRRLHQLLRAAFPDRPIEVWNLGVLGYSSFQGYELLRTWAIDRSPDAVVIAFAMNDGQIDGYRDRDLDRGESAPATLRDRLAGLHQHAELYKLARYALDAARYTPRPMAERLRGSLESVEGAQSAEQAVRMYAENEEWTRVSPADYEENLRRMVALVRERGALPVLLYNEFSLTSPYHTAVLRLAATDGVDLVDGAALIDVARGRASATREARLDLIPPPPPPAPALAPAGSASDASVDVVFRVDLGRTPVHGAASIAGPHPSLGGGEANVVALRDDGSHGDQRAGDGVWSLVTRFACGEPVAYVYTAGGARGRFENLDVPAVRSFVADAPFDGAVVYRPVEEFGRLDLQADPWHTNPLGYRLIAGAVFETLRPDLARRGSRREP